MPTPVLATKLFAPPLRPDLISRPRLVDQLNAGLQRKLLLVSAPAGYGKTTLISSWLRDANIPFVWLSLDDDDNDPVRFFQYLITTLQRIISSVGEGLTGISQGVQSISFDTSINLLINEITVHVDPFVIVLDDFHSIRSQAVLDLVTLLLERMPPQMHVVLLSRTDPPIPLPRLRARNQLLEIRAEQLRFTLEEISLFLNDNMRLNLSSGDLVAMAARTEGWIASLQLAGLSMQHVPDIHAFITAFTGSHHYIMDYLVEEVLNAQPEEIRAFLLRTSILDRMCASLCTAVTKLNSTEKVNGQGMLETLEQMNLFVIPLDNDRQWYRYHHLFADMLRRRLEYLFPHELSELHRRASDWYLHNELIPEAIQHALAAGDLERTIQLIEQNGFLLLIRGEISTLQKWIEAVDAYAQSRPWIHIFKAWIYALSGHPEQVETYLQAAESLISAQEPPLDARILQGTIATARAYQANLQGETLLAMQHARQALEDLTDDNLISCSLRTVAISLLGDASATNGDLDQARQAYSAAMQTARVAGDAHLMVVLNSNIANILMEQGRLRDAQQLYAETLEMTTRPDGQKPVIAGRLLAELSQLSYEWNDLNTATQQVQQSITLCRQWGNTDQQAVAYMMLAQLEHVQNHPEKMQEAIHCVEQMLEQHHLLPRYRVWVQYILVRLWMAQGEWEKASRLVEQSAIRFDDEDFPYLRELEYLALLRILLSEGEHEAALSLSQRVLQKAEVENRTRRVIETLILQALILQSRKDIDQALAKLEKALSLARPEQYVRTFLDEGEPMARLLHLAKARRIETDYVTGLLAGLEEMTGETQPSVRLLTEPLTTREVDVLKLIEAGCSNQEIADQLVISPATVKRHISNLYAKLGAQNRTQAVSIGRELRLVD